MPAPWGKLISKLVDLQAVLRFCLPEEIDKITDFFVEAQKTAGHVL
jgi:hypothetical protein